MRWLWLGALVLAACGRPAGTDGTADATATDDDPLDAAPILPFDPTGVRLGVPDVPPPTPDGAADNKPRKLRPIEVEDAPVADDDGEAEPI